MKAVVVGGGVVGLCCAYSLGGAGVETVVLEGGRVGAGASAGNAGWVTPSLATPLAGPGRLISDLKSALHPRGALVMRPALDTSWIRWLAQFRRHCTAERFSSGVRALLALSESTFEQLDAYRTAGVTYELGDAGILTVALDRKALAWYADLYQDLRRLGFQGRLEELSGDEARALEPALGPAVACATQTTVDRFVRPESLTDGLAAHLRTCGMRIDEGRAVQSVERSGGRWSVVTDQGVEQADVVVMATGVGTVGLLRKLGMRVPVIGAKGYSVTLRGVGRRPEHALYLCEPKVGVSPFSTGVRIAGVFELPGRDLSVDPRRIRQIVDDSLPFFGEWRPGPGEEHPAGWAGLRPSTPDGLPLLGPVSSHPGLYLATGHGMLGVTLGPASGAAIARMVTERAVPADLEPFRPDRSMW
jgi:D-amino-acid dehydrogenase